MKTSHIEPLKIALVLALSAALALPVQASGASHMTARQNAGLATVNNRLRSLSSQATKSGRAGHRKSARLQSGNLLGATADNPGTCPNQIYTAGSTPLMVSVATRIIDGPPDAASSYGVRVGDTFYASPNPPIGGAAGFQILVLDRLTLNCVKNVSVGFETTEDYELTDNVFLNSCGSLGCLFVVQSLQQPTYFQGIGYAFLALGGTQILDFQQASGTAYTLLGTAFGDNTPPGFERTTCLGSSCPQTSIQSGQYGVEGVFVQDNTGGYTFVYPGRPTYDTGTGSSATSNTVTLGPDLHGASYTGTYSGSYTSADISQSGASGAFQVVVLTRDSLAMQGNYTFDFNHLSAAQSGSNSMETTLQNVVANPNLMMAVSSIGSMNHSDSLSWDSVAEAIVAVGGNYRVFTDLSGSDGYSLIGAGGLTPASGAAETSSKVLQATSPAPPVARQSGSLARDRFGNMQAQAISFGPPSQLVAPLDAVALSSPTPWPFSSNANEIAVYQHLSSQICGCTSGQGLNDIRSQYTDRALDPQTWRDALTPLVNNPEPGYNATDWTNVANELVTEIGWLLNTQTAHDVIRNFYTDNQFGITQTLNTALQQVSNALPTAPSTTLSPRYAAILQFGQTIGGDLASIAGGPPAKLGFDLIMSGTNLAMALGRGSNGIPLSQVVTTTYDGLQMQAQQIFTNNRQSLDQVFDLLYTDPVRLQTVNDLYTNDVIVWDTNQKNAASASMVYAMKRDFIIQLIAPVYTLGIWNGQDDMQSVCNNYTSQANCSTFTNSCDPVFCNTPDSNSNVYSFIPKGFNNNNGNATPITDFYLAVPRSSDVACDSNTNPQPFELLFSPIQAGVDPLSNPNAGLGVYPTYYFLYQTGNINLQTNSTCGNNHQAN